MPFELDSELRGPFHQQLRVKRERQVAAGRRNGNFADRRQSEKQTVNGQQKQLRFGEFPYNNNGGDKDEKVNTAVVSMTKIANIAGFV